MNNQTKPTYKELSKIRANSLYNISFNDNYKLELKNRSWFRKLFNLQPKEWKI